MTETIRVALLGTPNCGKTTLFNALTGAHQHVGNWSGVTVECKSGYCSFMHRGHHHHHGRHHAGSDLSHANADSFRVEIVDLPGIYSLAGATAEETVSRDYVVEQTPEIVINVVEATNIERNLYLTVQLLEMRAHVVIALNMMDEVRAQGINIDIEKMSRLLGVPVIPISASSGEGLDELKAAVAANAGSPEGDHKHIDVNYPVMLEDELQRLEHFLGMIKPLPSRYSRRWLALRLIIGDKATIESIGNYGETGKNALLAAVSSRKHLSQNHGINDMELLLADTRIGFAHGLYMQCVKTGEKDRFAFSDMVDKVITSNVLGPIIFGLLMFTAFNLTFTFSEIPTTWLSMLVDGIAHLTGYLLSSTPPWLHSMVVDGVIGGVGGILVFLPNIFILFFLLAFLEDSGYMARAAFILDRFLSRFGLPGKAFIPLIVGAGCNLAGIMSCRTLDSRSDRIITSLVNPFISCSARLPIYALLIAAFFPGYSGPVLFFIYTLGIVVALSSAKLFRLFLFKGTQEPLVIELPPYRIPSLRNLLLHAWERGSVFLRKMGGVILVGSLVVWALGYFPQEETKMEDRWLGQVGKSIAPLVQPLGMDWQDSVALVSGLVAKENVVTTLGVIHGLTEEGTGDEEEMSTQLRLEGGTPLRALSFMVFTLLYIPCLATMAAIRRETGSWKWVGLSLAYGLFVAWLLAFTVFQGGQLLGFI